MKFFSVYFYYLFTLAFLMIVTASGIVVFHTNGLLNIDKINEVYEGNLFFESLKSADLVNSIKNEINKNQVREANRLLVSFEKRILGNNFRNKEFKNFQTTLRQTSKLFYNLIALPEPATIFEVLEKKVNDFNGIIEVNGWKTLLRLIQRVKTELVISDLGKNHSASFKKTQNLENFFRGILVKMAEVTKSSDLNQEKKELINAKIDNFQMEMEMLGKYTSQVTALIALLNETDRKLKKWQDASALDISFKKIEFERKNGYLLYSLLGLWGLITLFFIWGLFLKNIFQKKETKAIEKAVLNSIKEGLMNNKPFKGYSKEFIKEIGVIQEYIHQKISFGSIVFDSLPFATLFLDANLSIIWANNVFYQVFGIDDQSRELLTWDYVQLFTNLGENDPILLAHKNEVAGIYQIQVRKRQGDEIIPLELYVHPTTYQNQKRILLFFYPLKNLQDSLAYQIKSIIGPVTRVMEAMISNQFNENFKNSIQKDFQIGGIDILFSKFLKFHDLVNIQRTELLLQLEKMEYQLTDQLKLKADTVQLLKNILDNTLKAIMKISELKETFIYTIELREKVERTGIKIGESLKNSNTDCTDLLGKIEKLNSFVKDANKSIDRLLNLKESFNSEVSRFKNRKEAESFVENFANGWRGIEATISKIELTIKAGQEEKTDDFKERVIFSKNICSKQASELKEYSIKMAELDEKMVRLFKIIYEAQKETESSIKNINPLLNHVQDKEIS